MSFPLVVKSQILPIQLSEHIHNYHPGQQKAINAKQITMPINKKWTSFKERTCPTLSFSTNPTAIKIAVVILGTVYNILATILFSHSPSFKESGLILRIIFTFPIYPVISGVLVYNIGNSRGRRRILGIMVVSLSFIAL